jgi:phosphate transport system permease protein
MRERFRIILNHLFTVSSGASVAVLAIVLVIVLGPMLSKGITAVFFRSTVEFERLQFDRHERGDKQLIEENYKLYHEKTGRLYEIYDEFCLGLNVSRQVSQVRSIARDYTRQLRYEDTPDEEYDRLKDLSRDIRDQFSEALESQDGEFAIKEIDKILSMPQRGEFEGTEFARVFKMAKTYRDVAASMDLGQRDTYSGDLAAIGDLLSKLFGPRPGADKPPLAMNQYGATRWDRVQKLSNELLWKTQWQQQGEGMPLKEVQISRAQMYSKTPMKVFFDILENDLDDIFRPRIKVYWQYLIDDSTPGYFFGGIGPEVIGTLVLTLLAMLFAIPTGIISAVYLVEYAGDTRTVRLIRICINTLAGVPSIVFGLFGMAFFVLFLLPVFKANANACILTASLTLSVMILPIIIRASEEAIRAVPLSYKQAALALGAGELRTVMTVTLPAAMPGILTGIILSLSRAAGETAPILFTGAVALGPIAKSIFDPTRTLSYGSYNIAVTDRISMMVPHNQYGMVSALIILVLVLNLAAIIVRSRISKKLRAS